MERLIKENVKTADLLRKGGRSVSNVVSPFKIGVMHIMQDGSAL